MFDSFLTAVWDSWASTITNYRERIQQFRQTGNLKHLDRNELDKACFVLDATYSDSKDFAVWAISDKVLKDKAYVIAKNLKYGGYQRRFANMVYRLFDKKKKKKTGSGAGGNKELAKELHRPVIKKFKRRVYPRFKDNIWAADLAEMGSLSSFNCGVKYLLSVINVFTKNTWVKPLRKKRWNSSSWSYWNS